MPVNNLPVFTNIPNMGWTTISNANTAMDGTGTVNLLFTAGVNGALVSKIIAKTTGTNVDTVVRIFVNNGGANSTPGNNSFLDELYIPAAIGANNISNPKIELELDYALPPDYKLNVVLGTAVASAIALTCIGGNF